MYTGANGRFIVLGPALENQIVFSTTVQPHGAKRVLEVLKRANMGLSQGVLAARCLVARKDGHPCRAFGRPNTAEPHCFQAPSKF